MQKFLSKNHFIIFANKLNIFTELAFECSLFVRYNRPNPFIDYYRVESIRYISIYRWNLSTAYKQEIISSVTIYVKLFIESVYLPTSNERFPVFSI